MVTTNQRIDPNIEKNFLRDLLDKRKTKRSSVSFPVTLSRTINTQQYRIGGIAVNVSQNGAGVVLFVPVAVGSKLEMRANGGRVTARAVVRHCSPMPSGWIVGLEIIEQRGGNEWS